ncbi:hypothetical protein ACTFIZ_012109 [Dictyostelium cf. discoideum]
MSTDQEDRNNSSISINNNNKSSQRNYNPTSYKLNMSNINLQDLNQINQLSQDDINVVQPQWNELFFSKTPLNCSIQQHVEREVKKQKIVEKVRGGIDPNPGIEQLIQNINVNTQNTQTTVQTLQTTVQNLQTTVQTLQTTINSLNQRTIILDNDRIRKLNQYHYNNSNGYTPELIYKEIEGVGNFIGNHLQQFRDNILNANVGSRPTQNIEPILTTLRNRQSLSNLQISYLIKYYNNQMDINDADTVAIKTTKFLKFLGVEFLP